MLKPEHQYTSPGTFQYMLNRFFPVIVLFLLGLNPTQAQTVLKGQVTSGKGDPVPYASVFLKNTIDGSTTDDQGEFSFTSYEKGSQTLVVSVVGFDTVQNTVNLKGGTLNIAISLRESNQMIDEVVVTAGTFEANNDRKVAILKPLDIYTNSAAAGDIMGAIQTLPGTQKVTQETGLFVRGGDASESSVIIDGMTVQNPFFSNVPGVSQRSRFMPFQFKGISFSSGGFSARYSQALSSVLELNTNDLPEQSTLNFNIGMSGLATSGSKRWSNSGVEVSANYTNLSPFYWLAKTNYNVYDIPEGGGFSGRYVTKVHENGLLKAFIKYDTYHNGITIPNPDSVGNTFNFGLKNQNTYFNSSYRYTRSNMFIFTALSYSYNRDRITWGTVPDGNTDWRGQWRGECWYSITATFNLLGGLELQRFNAERRYDSLRQSFNEFQTGAYLEAEWRPSPYFAVKPGLRYERSELLDENSLAPRLAMALKTGKYGQVSLAGGVYYQNPDNNYLLYGYRPHFQQAIHYIVNYQRINNDRSFRVEVYYKQYNQLVRELSASDSGFSPNPYRYIYGVVDNSGNGYAQGIDFFWRDKASIPDFDYWISYSYIDTKRLYSNYISKATPDFISNHNLNILLKYFIEQWGMSVSTSYTYGSGRPYYNPDDSRFMQSHTPSIHDLSLSVSYLKTIGRWFTVFYVSVDNVFGWKNIYGYRYSYDGQQRYPVRPAIDRYVFIGANISLTQFSKDEL
jgi:outer membrane cobalamin receptor